MRRIPGTGPSGIEASAVPGSTPGPAPIKIFTVFYILVGIGILVELARQLGFAYVQVRREEQAAKADKADHTAET